MARNFRLGDGIPRPWQRASVTVGNFDGVHLGHQALVREVVKAARERGLAAVVLTFDPHPATVIGGRATSVLTRLPRKAAILQALGVDFVAVLDFTTDLAGLSPGGFAGGILFERLGAAHVVVGEGFRFGTGRAGDVECLRRLGEEIGFGVGECPPVLCGGDVVSSSRVREALAGGDVLVATTLCGRPFRIEGPVVHGEGRGREIGIPTANVATAWDDALPRGGVYACRVFTPEGQGHNAVVNIGTRPTFGGTTPRLEAHLPGFVGDLYGSVLAVDFVAPIREERRFASAEDLVVQIRADILTARILLEHPPLFG